MQAGGTGEGSWTAGGRVASACGACDGGEA